MISNTLRRAIATSCLLAAFSASAYCQKTFSFPHALERDGQIVAIAWDLSGGQTEFKWVQHIIGPGVRREIIPIGALYSLYGNEEIFKMVADSFEGKDSEYDYSIYSARKDGTKESVSLGLGRASQPSVSRVVLPACDVDSKDPAGVEVYFNPKEYTISKVTGDTSAAADAAKKQKLWHAANFQLTIGDLPCDRMRKVSTITVRPPNHDPEARIRVTPIDTEIGVADAAPFREALAKTLSSEVEYPFRLDYLDDDGNVLLSFRTTVVLASVDKANPLDPFDPADPANGDKPINLRWYTKGHVILMK